MEDDLLARTLAHSWGRDRFLGEAVWKELLRLRSEVFGRLTLPQREELLARLVDPARVRNFLRSLIGTELLKPGLSTEDEETRYPENLSTNPGRRSLAK